jgi:nitrite reductase (NADH) small subunit
MSKKNESETIMVEWTEIGSIQDIPTRGARVVETERGPIAVFRTGDDQIFALENRCPHKQGPLSEGIVHGHRVTCPLHSWVIELENGEAVAPDVGCAPSVPVRVDGGMISIGLPAAKRLAHG